MKKALKFTFLGLLGSVLTAQAQQSTSAELSCRSQAKEVAVQTYQSCVTTARQQRVDEIRKEYQTKLTELKAHYDTELKKMAPGSAVATKVNVKSGSAKNKKSKDQTAEVSSQFAVQTLPKKKNQHVQTLPVQTVQESSAAITEDSSSSDEQVNVVDPEAQSE